MTPTAFVSELDARNREHLRRIDALRDPACALPDRVEVIRRLKLALRQELEAAEIAALWLPNTPEVDVKLVLGQLCGDETKHYRLIAYRLQDLGEDVAAYDPLAEGRSRLYGFFAGLTDTVERVAAAHFTRESVGHVRNEQFIEFCEAAGDAETARMYRESIQPDEWAHAAMGRALLERYAVTEDAQARAAAASEKLLQMAEGFVEMLIRTQKMSNAPGC